MSLTVEVQKVGSAITTVLSASYENGNDLHVDFNYDTRNGMPRLRIAYDGDATEGVLGRLLELNRECDVVMIRVKQPPWFEAEAPCRIFNFARFRGLVIGRFGFDFEASPRSRSGWTVRFAPPPEVKT